ncbi:Golgi apparatus membrane protein TVP38 [Spathaspora sp. JA1]|nr:Golgi apparatus membrane protein TVP38 [Spathaspora sp. JA1]
MPRLHTNSDAHFISTVNPSSRGITSLQGLVAQRMNNLTKFSQHLTAWYTQQSPLTRIALGIFSVLATIGFILMLIFHAHIIKFLIYISEQWHSLKYGSVILFSLVFMVGFPPLIGFTALSMLTGMIYGFPQGWPLLASASILGCIASFFIYRYLLLEHAQRFTNRNETFKALGECMTDDNSLILLVLIRLCPLPYSLSNGALSSIPNLSARTYIIATAITSPKLLIHLFVGHKLKSLGDETRSGSTKFIDLLSIVITLAAASITAYIIYFKMQKKLASYHNRRNYIDDDVLVFGNFEDDLEMNENNAEVDLNSADFDADNFIIEDEEFEHEHLQEHTK